MSSFNKIKNYTDYSTNRRRSGRFNRIHIEGSIKGGFLSKSKPFEVIVYFTPVKKIIFDTYIDGVDKSKLELTFKIGDDIQKAKDWAKENNYEITFERNK